MNEKRVSESSVILSRERFMPSDGVLIDPNKITKESE